MQFATESRCESTVATLLRISWIAKIAARVNNRNSRLSSFLLSFRSRPLSWAPFTANSVVPRPSCTSGVGMGVGGEWGVTIGLFFAGF